MTLSKKKERAYVALTKEQRKMQNELSTKYDKSGGKILSIAFDLLAAQEKAGFEIPALKK